jgi:arginine repressor
MPKEVSAAMKEQGIDVTRSTVSVIKFNMLKKRAAMRKEKAAAAAKKLARKPQTTATAASANGAAGGTKADAIRDVARGMDKPVRPPDVIAVLKAQGVKASSAQVSTVLRGMGMRRKRRRKTAVGSPAPAAAASSASLNISDLVAAKKLVGQFGSIEKVKEALAALVRLG